MTVKEFSYEFDIKYDSIAGPSAPGLNEYEKSVFLTSAQLELVKEYFGPINKYRDSFEESSKRRADLRELVFTKEITPTASLDGIVEGSYDVKLPEDLFLIIYEVGYYTPPGCTSAQKVDITPTKYDELSNKLENPFRGPLKKRGFRLDKASFNDDKRSELVVGEGIDKYVIRYVKYPSPIILTDLDGIQTSLPLSIDGVVEKTECALDKEIHREILDRAVELAMLSYKQEGLNAAVQLHQRNN